MTVGVNHLTEQLAETRETLAEHGARITNVEKTGEANSTKLDRLLYWILGVLATSVIGLLLQLIKGK